MGRGRSDPPDAPRAAAAEGEARRGASGVPPTQGLRKERRLHVKVNTKCDLHECAGRPTRDVTFGCALKAKKCHCQLYINVNNRS